MHVGGKNNTLMVIKKLHNTSELFKIGRRGINIEVMSPISTRS